MNPAPKQPTLFDELSGGGRRGDGVIHALIVLVPQLIVFGLIKDQNGWLYCGVAIAAGAASSAAWFSLLAWRRRQRRRLRHNHPGGPDIESIP